MSALSLRAEGASIKFKVNNSRLRNFTVRIVVTFAARVAIGQLFFAKAFSIRRDSRRDREIPEHFRGILEVFDSDTYVRAVISRVSGPLDSTSAER